jgi:hypothetical protein
VRDVKLTDNEVKDLQGTHFLMKGGPYDGMTLRVFKPDWSVLDLSELGGVYVRPTEVDPYGGGKSKSKKRIPYMEWSEIE